MPFQLDQVPPQKGRVAIVTGANTGLGYETALAFAQKQIHTVMACRTESRARDAMEKIQKEVSGAELTVLPLDLSDLDSVRSFAEAFRKDFDKLDLLVLNAGIMMPPYSKTKDGFESQMGANYFGHFLLTSLLLDLMPDDPASRVVTLSSNGHRMGEKRILFEDMHWEKKSYSAIGAYAQTKLACLMFANELNKRLDDNGKKIRALSAHPGVSPTELARHMNKALLFVAKPLFSLMSHAPDKGALPQIQAALDDKAEGGDYYGPTGPREMRGPPGKVDQLPYAKDEGHLEQLWQVSKELTGAVFPWESGATTEAA